MTSKDADRVAFKTVSGVSMQMFRPTAALLACRQIHRDTTHSSITDLKSTAIPSPAVAVSLPPSRQNHIHTQNHISTDRTALSFQLSTTHKHQRELRLCPSLRRCGTLLRHLPHSLVRHLKCSITSNHQSAVWTPATPLRMMTSSPHLSSLGGHFKQSQRC